MGFSKWVAAGACILAGMACISGVVVGCSADDCPLCTGGSGGATTSTGSGGSGAAAGGTGGAAVACAGIAANSNAECDECRAFECCTEAQACAAEPECKAWLACEDACDISDGGCLRTCWAENPASPAKGAYAACRQRSCAPPCGLDGCENAGFGYQDLINVQDDCAACRREHCCETATECLENADCQEALECFATCGDDPVCFAQECSNAEHLPLMVDLADDWACRNRYCFDACEETKDCSVFWAYGGSCATCVHDSCCAEAKACADDSECIEYAICTLVCGDDEACETACGARHWRGAGLRWVESYCLSTNCSSQCSEPARACGGFIASSTGCGACMATSCCDQGDACGRSSDCAAIHVCVETCGADAECEANCIAAGPTAGAASYEALATCRTTQCAVECPAG